MPQTDFGVILGPRLGLRWGCVAGSGTAETVTLNLSPTHPEAPMSSLEQRRPGQYHLVFRFGGTVQKALKTTQTDVAEAARVRLDENLRLVAAGRLIIPEGADIPTFLLSDGKLNGKPKLPSPLTLSKLFQEYLDHLPDGAMESNSLYTAKVHMAHFERVLARATRSGPQPGRSSRLRPATGEGEGPTQGPGQPNNHAKGIEHAERRLELGAGDKPRGRAIPQQRAPVPQDKRKAAIPNERRNRPADCPRRAVGSRSRRLSGIASI